MSGTRAGGMFRQRSCTYCRARIVFDRDRLRATYFVRRKQKMKIIHSVLNTKIITNIVQPLIPALGFVLVHSLWIALFQIETRFTSCFRVQLGGPAKTRVNWGTGN